MKPPTYTRLPGGTCIWTPEEFRAEETRSSGIAYLAMLFILTLCAVAAVLIWRSVT